MRSMRCIHSIIDLVRLSFLFYWGQKYGFLLYHGKKAGNSFKSTPIIGKYSCYLRSKSDDGFS